MPKDVVYAKHLFFEAQLNPESTTNMPKTFFEEKKKKFFRARYMRKKYIILRLGNTFGFDRLPYFLSTGWPVLKLVIRQCLGVKGLRVEFVSVVLFLNCCF